MSARTKSVCKLRALTRDRYIKKVVFEHPDDNKVRKKMMAAMRGQRLRPGGGIGINITTYQHLDAGTLREALNELDEMGVLKACELDYWRRADGADLPVVDVWLKRKKD